MLVKPEILAQRVQASFQKLSAVATNLNIASDKLGKSITDLESSLKRVGLGIASWVAFSSEESADGFNYSAEEIGYAKIGGKWGFAIRIRSGNERDDDEDVESWHFNEAPRHLRVRALAKIPDLLDKLAEDGAKFTKEVDQGAEIVENLTAALDAMTLVHIPKHTLLKSDPVAGLGTPTGGKR